MQNREDSPVPGATALDAPAGLAGDTAVLYVSHAVGLLVPLVTVPYLARVLLPSGWGPVVFAQSLAAWLILVAEYGFDLSGTRAVARALGDSEAIARVVSGVLGAKLLVALCLLPIVAGLWYLVPTFRAEPRLLLWAWGFTLAKGLSPAWYFFGVQSMKRPALAEAAARVLAAAGVFVWVRSPEDGWRVLALQAGCMAAAVAWLTYAMYRETEPRLPTVGDSAAMLREGAGIFLFRGASGLYYQANAFILGLVGSPLAAAFFGGAEKIVRAGIGLYQPLTQALFPRMSHLVDAGGDRADQLFKTGLLLFGGMGLGLAAVIVLAAPWLVAVILGPGYGEAVPVMRLLALLPMIIAVGTVFGIHWALPAGHERPFYRLVAAAGVLNVTLAVALVPPLGAVGMAYSVIAAEVLVATGLLLLYRRAGGSLLPLRLPAGAEG